MVKDLEALVKNLPREMSIVSGKTARRGKSIIAKEVATELAVPQKVIRAQVTSRKVGKTGAATHLSKSKRIPLRDFKARQTKKGVSYKISKTGGRRMIAGAFQGPRPGQHQWSGRVFIRKGKKRLPIQQLFGPSPWGVFVKKKKDRATKQKLHAELRKQIAERLRYRKLKASGAI